MYVWYLWARNNAPESEYTCVYVYVYVYKYISFLFLLFR